MTDKDSNELRDVVRQAVAEALAGQAHTCRFNVSDNDATEFGHLMGMAKDLGDGNVGAGIELMRDNHKRIDKTRKLSDKIATVILNTLITSLVIGVITALVAGIRVVVK